MPSSLSSTCSLPSQSSSPTPNPPSSPAAAARPRISKPRRTLSNRISHLVSRFEPVPPILAEPLLSVQACELQDREVEEVGSYRGQVELLQQRREATIGEIQGATARETDRRLQDATAESEPRVTEKGEAAPQVGADSARAQPPTIAKSPQPHPLADGDRSTTVRSLPTYGETLRNDAHGAQSADTPAISRAPTRDALDDKGDLGFSNPFDDIFAAHDDLEDPLLAHLLRESDIHRPPPARDVSPSLPPTTRSVPLYRVFARDAEPLVLPALDDAINALGGAAHFTPMPKLSSEGDFWRGPKLASLESESTEIGATGSSDEGKADSGPLNGPERAGWERWLREGPPQSRWTRFSASLSALSPFRRRAKRSDPLDEAAQRARLTTEKYKRSLIFPPFHLLPPGVTVTDLKANRRKPAPLFTWQTILKIVGNGILGAAGSSTGISLTTIEGLRDLMQLVTLLVSASGSPLLPASHAVEPPSGALRTVFVTVPAFLSLDFVTAYGRPFIFLLVLTFVTLAALYELMRFTGGWRGPGSGLKRGKLDRGEGFDSEATVQARQSWRDLRVWHIVVTFWCSSVYLPLSKLAIGALVFTDDYWPVANPYLASGQDTPNPSPLGPAKEFHAPLDFCYRTTMRRDTINLSFVLLPIAGIVILALSFWLPWRLRSVINHEKPQVDAWTELGERRRDLNAEYQRLLETDPSPFSFLCKDFRRPWATFRSIYLIFKLLNVLIVVVVQKNNCLFRQHSTRYLSVIRQGCLLAFLSLYSLFAMKTLPYLDIPSNSSDVCSRIGYSLLAMLGLLAALGLPRTDPATLFVNIVLYSLSIYFVVISTSWAQRLVKKAQRRIDFSIDIFSPALNLDKHLNRRVWQGTLATIFLCSPEFAMPPGHPLAFNDDVSPYLFGFTGSQAERLIENLKILRTIGLTAYQDAVARLTDPRLSELRDIILSDLLGPDRYYDPVGLIARTSSLFGRIDVVPFPSVVIFRYDGSPTPPLHLLTVDELELLVSQNSSAQVQAARRVRLALRALDGQVVFAPHSETLAVSSYFRSRIERQVTYRQAVLHVARNSTFEWNGYNCSSGFAVRLDYSDGESIDPSGRVRHGSKGSRSGTSIGVFPSFQLSKPLAILFRQNRHTIEARQPQVEATLQAHADHFAREAASKEHTLSYSMLLSAFLGRDLDSLAKHESSLAVRHLGSIHALSLRSLEERWRYFEASPARVWWYLLWDDLWRRNRSVADLPEHCFSPHYSTSICYQPMTRKDLEVFLRMSGIGTGKRSFFHLGLLNRIYFHLDMLLLTDTSRIIPVHLPGETTTRISRLAARIADVHQKEVQHAQASRFTVSTGAGTDENDGEIRQRTAYLWEEAIVEPRPSGRDFTNYLRWLFATCLPQKTAVFLGLSPLVSDWRPRQGDELLIDLADLHEEDMQCEQ